MRYDELIIRSVPSPKRQALRGFAVLLLLLLLLLKKRHEALFLRQ